MIQLQKSYPKIFLLDLHLHFYNDPYVYAFQKAILLGNTPRRLGISWKYNEACVKVVNSKETRKRGRPSTLNRDKAATDAMMLFWERGYDAVGVAELSNTIGVTAPSLYNAFGDKHGLFEAAITQYESLQGEFITSAVQSADSSADLMKRILTAAAEIYTQPRKPRGCLVLDGANNSNCLDATETVAERQKVLLTFLKKSFSTYEKAGATRKAFYTLTAMRGLSSSARMNATKKQLIEVAHYFSDVENLM